MMVSKFFYFIGFTIERMKNALKKLFDYPRTCFCGYNGSVYPLKKRKKQIVKNQNQTNLYVSSIITPYPETAQLLHLHRP